MQGRDNRRGWICAALVLLLLLPACGTGQTAQESDQSEPTQAVAAVETATDAPTEEPTATDAPTEEPTTTDVPTEEPTATDAPTEEPTEAPATADNLYLGVPQGFTEQGEPRLGFADAPVVFKDFSDFL